MQTLVTKDEINSTLRKAKIFFLIGIVVTAIMPFLLIKGSFIKGLDFSNTGPIGDTIGGITAPFVNILGAVLVYYALKSQTQANLAVQYQIDEQASREKLQNESNEISKLYDNLKSTIDDFSFSTLQPYDFGKSESLKGSESIYNLFQEFYCEYHGSEDDMACNPKIGEVISMLEICARILNKLDASNIPDKEVMKLLTVNQFQYRIAPRINLSKDELSKHYCGYCEKDHGLPNRIVELINEIRSKASLKENEVTV